jgi:hypothetical protein
VSQPFTMAIKIDHGRKYCVIESIHMEFSDLSKYGIPLQKPRLIVFVDMKRPNAATLRLPLRIMSF